MSIQTLGQAVIILNPFFPSSTTSIHVCIPTSLKCVLPLLGPPLELRSSPFCALNVIILSLLISLPHSSLSISIYLGSCCFELFFSKDKYYCFTLILKLIPLAVESNANF